jgi:ABC-type sugar transport system substrate-binding protein
MASIDKRNGPLGGRRLIALAAIAAIAVAACSSGSSSSTAPSAARSAAGSAAGSSAAGAGVTLITKTATNPFFVAMAAGAKEGTD